VTPLPHLARRIAPRPRGVLASLLILCLMASTTALSQQDTAPSAQSVDKAASPLLIEPSLTTELVDSRIQETEASVSLTDEAKADLIEQYRKVLSSLEQVKAFNAKTASFRQSLESAPQETAEIRSRLQAAKDAPKKPEDALPPAADIEEVEQMLARALAEAASLDAKIAEADTLIDDINSQPDQLRKRAGVVKDALETIKTELAVPPTEGASSEARQWVLESRRDALSAELLAIDQQILSNDVRDELARARRDQLVAERSRLDARRAQLAKEADRLRQLAAEQARSETAQTERETAGAHPLVRALAERNRELSDNISRITQALEQQGEQQAALERRAKGIEQDYRSARERLAAAGLNRALGHILIDERARLPDLRQLRREAERRADLIAETSVSEIRHRDELRQLRETDTYLDEVTSDIEDAPREQLRVQLGTLAERRVQLLEDAIDIEQSYRRALAAVDFAAAQLIDITERYDNFLSERLLWVRNIQPLMQQSFAALPTALYWLIAPGNWADVGRTLAVEALRSPLFWAGSLAVMLLLWHGRRIRRAIRATADDLRRISTDRFASTLKALGLSLLLAIPWPLLLLLLGWQLSGSLESSAFAKATGAALLGLVPALYYLRAFRLLCMPGGVADRHFRWHSDVLSLLRRTFAWAVFILMPVGFVASAVYNLQDADFSGTVGRLSLALLQLGFAVFIGVLMHPRRGAVRHLLAERPQSWANRLRMLWYPLVVLVPIALAILALSGYLYTSGTLLRSLVGQLWLVLGLMVVHQLIVRWLIITRRSLALQAALERRAVREAQREEGRGSAPATAESILSVEEQSVDLASLDTQTRKLLNMVVTLAAVVGLWLIWSDVLPALNLLDRFTLWSYRATVDGIEQSVPVTLADIGLILVIVLIATAAGRNLPALLEILLLKHTAVSAGSRYTIITLTGYAITAIGALFVFGILGLSWGEVQWLVAALGVGIGFGLQEIVANFISGLIILFERPVRVGDVVTVGDTTGVVTKIEIRATTIRNWDRQELLVPNKEFITGRLLNWTLTDQVNRLTIPVGVDYGADTRLALQLLSQIAAEHPRVLDDPAPIISFEGFGDNALNLVLRCFLDSMDDRLRVITELHQAIHERFHAAGIGIAFPQRDIHLRSAAPLEVRVSGGAPLPPERDASRPA
jgi:potassium efflux system protein